MPEGHNVRRRRGITAAAAILVIVLLIIIVGGGSRSHSSSSDGVSSPYSGDGESSSSSISTAQSAAVGCKNAGYGPPITADTYNDGAGDLTVSCQDPGLDAPAIIDVPVGYTGGPLP